MESIQFSQDTDPRLVIRQAHLADLPAVPINTSLLKPTVDPAFWLEQASLDAAIDLHWPDRHKEDGDQQPDGVGYVVENTHLVVSAKTAVAADRLHSLCTELGAEPIVTTLGKGGETMHFKLAATQAPRLFPASSELAVMRVGEVCLLHPQGTCEFSGKAVPLSSEFERGLMRIIKETAGPIEVQARPAASNTKEIHPLNGYSLTGTSAKLRETVQAAGDAIGGFAYIGQCTALFAAPNGGKTLIAVHALEVAICNGSIAAGNVYYLNLDDNCEGLLTKVMIAERLGFHMIADGHQGFASSEFLPVLKQLIESPHAMGMVLVLDTVKKLADLMDKRAMVGFTAAIRRFVLRGGTVIALAHTNKHVGANGRPVYAGTSDMVDDFDCAWTMQAVPSGAGSNTRLVSMKNFKRRGPLPDSLVYSYTVSSDYTELLSSVRQVPEAELAQVEQQAQMAADADLIEIVIATIQRGKTTRMDLVAEARKEAQVSRKEILRVLDAYRGNDPDRHHWDFTVIAKGAKAYRLIGAADTY